MPSAKISLTRQDVVDTLEEIARDPKNRAAQLAALRQLEELREKEDQEDGAFSDLDGQSVQQGRRGVRLKAVK